MIRHARPEDAPRVVDLVGAMLDEMASLGGHAVNGDSMSARASLTARITDHLAHDGHLYLIAEAPESPRTMKGFLAAHLLSLDGVFLEKRRLHVSGIHVVPWARRQGIGRQLLENALAWGRERGCDEADLNVLIANPARRLYEATGFEAFELAMVKKLR